MSQPLHGHYHFLVRGLVFVLASGSPTIGPIEGCRGWRRRVIMQGDRQGAVVILG